MNKLILGEVCEKIGSGATPRGGSDVYLPHGNIALIRSQNIYNDGFKKDGLAYITEVHAKELDNVAVELDDILLNITGDSVARCCQVPKELIPARVNQHVAIIRPKKDNLDTRYLRYYLVTPQMQDYMLMLASGGATRNALTKGMIESFEISAPSLPEQRAIAEILGMLDDKIEVNRRMNVTLESMARAVFRQWFVDGEEVAGWKVGRLREIISIKHGFAFKGEFFSEEETDDVLLTPGNFKIGGGFNYSKFKYYKGEVPQDYVLEQGDLIVTMTDLSKEGDTLGYSALVPSIANKKLLHNQRIGKVELLKGNFWKPYLYFLMQQKDYRDFVLSGASGTTVRHTSPTKICDYKLAFPSLDLLHSFEDITRPLIKHIEHNLEESRTLASLRDSLLPKLMRGEVRVKDVEKEL